MQRSTGATAAVESLREAVTRYLTALGDPTGAQPREYPAGLALCWVIPYLTSEFVTWATRSRMHSAPTLGGAPAPMNLERFPRGIHSDGGRTGRPRTCDNSKTTLFREPTFYSDSLMALGHTDIVSEYQP